MKIREQKPEHAPGNQCGKKTKTPDEREENEKGRHIAQEKEAKQTTNEPRKVGEKTQETKEQKLG